MMAISEFSHMALAFTGGILLGTFFFGGLWFTVKKTVTANIPARWIFVSFILRISIVLVGFYFIGLGDWKKMIACLIGFIIARFIVIYYTKKLNENKFKLKKEADHET